ncbi:MAG: DNA mismatch repair protein MutS [archaeon]|nr:DNA mismatch repair protein MutS [archaeon]
MEENDLEESSNEKNHWSKLNRNTLPPMMQNWYDIKSKYPDHLIAYRMGDFYEFFYEPDVSKCASLLGLTKTFRGSGPNRHPLAGIPHKAKQHFKNLIKMGETVVIVEQLESPSIAKAEKRIVKRGVVQIISPGTIIDESLLDASKNNYLVSIAQEGKEFGVAFIDLSCGDFFCTEFKGNTSIMDLFSIITRFEPVECIISNKIKQNSEFLIALKENCNPNLIIKEYNMYAFQYDNSFQQLIEHFGTKSLDGFGISGMKAAICAAGAILSFLNETQKTVLKNITNIKRYLKEEIMYLDGNTQKNLEILRNLQDNSEYGSLVSILNRTVTPMGNRHLKKIIVQPLLSKKKIDERLSIVELFKKDALLCNDLRENLSGIGDMERIISRINYSRTANGRDLVFLKNALKILPSIKNTLGGIEIKPLKKLVGSFGDYTAIIKLIETALKDDPPITITEGGIIRDGYDSRIDEMRDSLKNGKDWVLNFEKEQKELLNISAGLKIGFNRVLGYFIQITDNAAKGKRIPEHYQQRQKLKGSTRYITEDLKQEEVQILNADETIKDIEYELFSSVREEVAKETKRIQEDAQSVSMLDIICSFGDIASKNNYCRPKIMEHDKVIIKNGRHPVIEQINYSEPFIPNNNYMDTDKDQILVITGPNWSGKSTYLRQVALITIMAQIGSFVPASEAEIGIVDRVFTRIGASDDLTRGQSTFMMEMNETAQILNYATGKSLVIIDELGRGTSTTDGKSIARAVLEFLHDKGIKTLFSTHFHELIEIHLSRMKNYHFLIKEEGRKLIFLRKLTEGGTDKSYGIHVAEMAGVPNNVVDRAFDLVETVYDDSNLNGKKSQSVKVPRPDPEKRKKKQKKTIQTLLFMPEKSENDSEVIKKIKSVKLESLTPIEAMEFLIKLKNKL